jgi:hypothetical protein
MFQCQQLKLGVFKNYKMTDNSYHNNYHFQPIMEMDNDQLIPYTNIQFIALHMDCLELHVHTLTAWSGGSTKKRFDCHV